MFFSEISDFPRKFCEVDLQIKILYTNTLNIPYISYFIKEIILVLEVYPLSFRVEKVAGSLEWVFEKSIFRLTFFLEKFLYF